MSGPCPVIVDLLFEGTSRYVTCDIRRVCPALLVANNCRNANNELRHKQFINTSVWVFLSVVGETAIRPRSSRPVAHVPPQESVPPAPQPEQCQLQVSWPSLPAQEAFHGPDMAVHCRDEAAQTPVEEKGPPLDKDSQWFKQFSGSARVACVGPQDVAIGDGLYLVAPAHSGELAFHVCPGPETVCKRAQGRAPCRRGFCRIMCRRKGPRDVVHGVQ